MNNNSNLIHINENAHLEHLSLQLNYLVLDAIEKLAKQIGDCVFDNERIFIESRQDMTSTYLEITDKYAKHLDDIIAVCYKEIIKQFDIAMNEYKSQIISAIDQKESYT